MSNGSRNRVFSELPAEAQILLMRRYRELLRQMHYAQRGEPAEHEVTYDVKIRPLSSDDLVLFELLSLLVAGTGVSEATIETILVARFDSVDTETGSEGALSLAEVEAERTRYMRALSYIDNPR